MQHDQVYKNRTLNFRNIIAQNMQNNVKSNNKLQIPCVVHVFHINDGNTSNHGELSPEEVREGIRICNEYFKNYNIDNYGVDVNIELVLAARDENGNCTDGIDYIDLSNNSDYRNHGLNFYNSNGVYAQVLYAHRWDPLAYYNIYVVIGIDGNCPSSSGIRGYANLPGAHGTDWDGTYIRYCAFSETTLAHEIGHALNLYHTFAGDGDGAYCPSNGNCTTDGDECCDTPPHMKNFYCPCGTNSCDNNSKNSLYTKNVMSYNYCRMGFTNDQKTRMRTTMNYYRDYLLYSNGNMNLIPPSTGITFDISASKTSIKVADSTTLFTLSLIHNTDPTRH